MKIQQHILHQSIFHYKYIILYIYIYTGPTISETCDTVVPLAAPKYSTLAPGAIHILVTPPKIAAPNLDLNGFHARYSLFSPVPSSTEIRFSPYTVVPGTRLSVQSTSSLGDFAIYTPACLLN